jgi:hypothetical protein
MTVITVLALLVSLDVARYRPLLLVLAAGKAVSSLTCLGLFIDRGRVRLPRQLRRRWEPGRRCRGLLVAGRICRGAATRPRPARGAASKKSWAQRRASRRWSPESMLATRIDAAIEAAPSSSQEITAVTT